MITSALIAVLVAAEEPAATSEAIPTSAAMYISLLEPVALAGGTSPISVAPINANLRAGAILFGRHALLLGISFSTQFDTQTAGMPTPGGGTTVSIMPTYRFFLTPLRASGFSPYVQGEIFVGYLFLNSMFGGGGGTTTIPWGFGGGFGAEYLFARHFGLTAGVGLRFIRSETKFAGMTQTAANAVGMYVSAGLAVHF